MFSPPGIRVDDEISYRPGMVVDEHVLYVADFSIRRRDMVADEILAASQVVVVRRLSRRRTPGLHLCFDGIFGAHATGVCSHAPQTGPAPVIRVTEVAV